MRSYQVHDIIAMVIAVTCLMRIFSNDSFLNRTSNLAATSSQGETNHMYIRKSRICLGWNIAESDIF